MVFRNIVPSHLNALSLQQALELSNIYLENAYGTADPDIALVLCHETEVALSQAKSANKKYPAHPKDTGHQSLRDGVAAAYIDLGKLMEKQGYRDEAQAICKKAEKWG
jgi:tetratricopeptide (TPR) repeat protein